MQRGIKEQSWQYYQFVLADTEVAERGHMACLDIGTGMVVPGKTDTTLLPIGWFDEDLTGDGVKKVNVKLFRELWLQEWGNAAAPNNVEAADLGNNVHILDSSTVTTDATGRSVAGRAIALTANGVLVSAPRI